MAQTSIEWTDHSINPIRARLRSDPSKTGHHCEKISPGCLNCYASRMQLRFGLPEFGGPSRREDVELFFDTAKIAEVLRRKKTTRYFWCDMTDLFLDGHPRSWIHQCFAAMALTPHHTHQVLTKRADRLFEFMSDPDTPRTIASWMAGGAMIQAEYKDYTPPWPPPNVWLGVSVEDQARAHERVPPLVEIPARVRFLSVEPLLGPVDLSPWLGSGKIHWVILGGESGPQARPCHVAWIRDLVAQCRRAKVAPFVKQLGTVAFDPIMGIAGHGLRVPEEAEDLVSRRLRDPKGGDPSEWPEDLRVREFPVAIMERTNA